MTATPVKTRYVMWGLGAFGLASAALATVIDPPRLTAADVVPILIFAVTAYLAGLYQIRITASNVVSICVATFMGGVLAFGPVVGAWLAGIVDLFITVADAGRIKKGLAAPPPPDVAPGRILYNTGLNALMFLAGGYAYHAAGGAFPLRDVSPGAALALVAFFVTLEIVNNVFPAVVQYVRGNRDFKSWLSETRDSSLFDLPLLPAAFVFSTLYARGMLWALAMAGSSVVFASALLNRQNRLDLVVKRYVSAAKSSKILANPYELMQPERRNISVIFCDLRGNTSISQTLEPAAMLSLLNTFHAAMIEEVIKAGATVDKLLGDGLMILVGAPLREEDHAARAVQLAVALQRRHRVVQETLRGRSLPAPGMGVGVSTGEVVIGNVGSEMRLDYTAIGGEVNVASKLCSAAEEGEILISHATRRETEASVKEGRTAALASVRFEDVPPLTVARLEQRLRAVRVVYI